MNQAMRSTSVLRPKRSWPSVLKFVGWIQRASESSLRAALSWRIGRCLKASMFCRRLRHGFFRMDHSSKKPAISTHENGNSRKGSIRNLFIENSERLLLETFLGTSTATNGSRCR